MSQTAITLAFEQWKAQQAATGEPVLLDEFVFALVPDLDPNMPVDRSETLPPAAQIVHREPVTRKGVVNENAVVHSAVLGADVGDFSFNWIGLTNRASGLLAMIVHAPEQQKLKTKEGQQGNVLTRSFLMEFNGAQAETAINTPAETWQIDFTARMVGMDERQRLENTDIYGAAAFFDDGWLVGKTGNQFFVTRGAGYVAGLRAVLAADQNITVTTKPVNVWLDVCWTGSLTGVWNVQSKVTVAGSLEDYEQSGIKHYVFALAGIDASGNITDLRPQGSRDGQEASDALEKHARSRNHPDASLTEKGFVSLSSSTSSDSEYAAATPKAVKVAMDNANGRYSQNGGVLDGSLEAKGDVTAVSGNVCARANPDNKSGGAYIFQKIVDGAVVNTGSVMSESDGGHLQINPSSLNCFIRFNGKTVSTHPDSYRIVSGNRGQFWRFDGSTLYLMFTREDEPYGTWNDLRPLMAEYATGKLSTGHDFSAGGALSCGGDFAAGGKVYSGNRASYFAEDGNSYGPVWGGWLSSWLSGQLNGRVSSFRLAGWGTATNGNNDNLFANAPDGAVVVGVQQKTNYTAVNYRYPQIYVNGNWMNVGVA